MLKNGDTVPMLVRPYGCPLPAVTVMLTGAEVLLKPLPSVATAVSA